ncbi:MAG: phosphate signaling complex protein PhoU [Chitinophagales bacterium]|nr:phosphate signaling complex protein PhoU [Chitinophagales bacterium]MDW8428416.1 phosphate signaling complex protein PhoU [Chitinophagales bacterium]
MTHLDSELNRLKGEIEEMGNLVRHQLRKSVQALVHMRKDLAREVLFQERRINATELKIDRDCENIMALFNPVAIDLRLVFAAFKINSHLERMGDHSKGIASYALELQRPLPEDLLEKLELFAAVDQLEQMIESNIMAFRDGDSAKARKIFQSDGQLDAWNRKAIQIVIDYFPQHPDRVADLLNVNSTVRKLERIGDLNKNIAEEIIFYVEAHVLKHEKEKI